ncbi:MAG: AAA family ATPase [Polyangiaceae bacterium]
MITRVEITNLRGLASGCVEGLGRLAILLGANGAGKSTVLDAMVIGAGAKPASAVGFVVRRRAGLNYGARWLFHRGGFAGPNDAKIVIDLADGKRRSTTLKLIEGAPHPELRRRLVERGVPGVYRSVDLELRIEDHGALSGGGDALTFGKDNTFTATDEEEPLPAPIWLIDPDPRISPGLHKLFSRISERGQRLAVRDLLRPLIPGLDILELAVDEDDGRLNLAFPDRSIPVALAGEGIHALVRLALEIATSPAETLLIEEPEAHAHPAAVRQIARAIVQGVRNGKQTVLTSHSLEMIDALLDALQEDELGWLTVHGMRLDEGRLHVARTEGPAVLLSRDVLGEDLR